MPPETTDSEISRQTDIRALAKTALLQLLEPLAGFVSDSGLSAGQLHSLFREAAVRSSAAQQLKFSGRVNISGISATTGIPRSDISKILKQEATQGYGSDDHQQSTNRILSAWHADPKFTTQNGKAADLNVFGRGASFESLVKKYGRGIPVRAVLDELSRTGAVELLSLKKIRAKASISVEHGLSARVIKNFGDRAAELLNTMLSNMREPESPKFIATVQETQVASSKLPLFRRELFSKSEDFLADVHETLAGAAANPKSRRGDRSSAMLSVTVYYHEKLRDNTSSPLPKNRRRNLRRNK